MMSPALDLQHHQQVLAHYGFPSVAVDEALRVVHLSHGAKRYLPGLTRYEPLLPRVPVCIHQALRAAVTRACSDGTARELPAMRLPSADMAMPVRLTVHPVETDSSTARALLVLIRCEATDGEGSEPEEAVNQPSVSSQGEPARRRHGGLSDSGLHACSRTETIEMMNEELRVANEELHAQHDELRAKNEQLEEVDDALRAKIRQQNQATSDLEHLIAAADVGTLFLDSDLHIRRFTRHLQQLFHLRPQDVGRRITDLTTHLPYEAIEHDVRQVIEHLVPLEREVGTDAGRWYLIRLRPYLTNGDRIDGTVLTFVDITERRHAEKALRRSEARSRAILHAIPDPIYRLARDGVLLDVEAASEHLLPAPAAQLVGRSIADVLPDGVAMHVLQAASAIRRHDAAHHVEFTATTMDGHQHEFEGRLTAIDAESVLLITRDVTEQRRLERQIVRVSTNEQQRIGRDLHDVLGSQLFGISMLAGKLSRRARTDRPIDPDRLDELAALARDAISQTRSLAQGLCPFARSTKDLVSALRALANESAAMSDLSCTMEADADLPDLGADVNAQLYRIAQEAVTNALRHAEGATRVAIRLGRARRHLVLTVRDDGCGLRPERKTERGMGLHVMRYRARMIGAVLRIEAPPSGGTLVSCTLNLTSSLAST